MAIVGSTYMTAWGVSERACSGRGLFLFPRGVGAFGSLMDQGWSVLARNGRLPRIVGCLCPASHDRLKRRVFYWDRDLYGILSS